MEELMNAINNLLANFDLDLDFIGTINDFLNGGIMDSINEVLAALGKIFGA